MAKLTIVGMPIGNFEDITLRCLAKLKTAQLILCEDTRETSKALSFFGIQANLVSYIGSYDKAISLMKSLIAQNQDVILVSDKGMPCISDPGTKIINIARKMNIGIECLPGVSAVTTAYALTGYSKGYAFYGFVNLIKLKEILSLSLNLNLIFYESAIRLPKFLNAIHQINENIEITLCKDLTKKYQDIKQGKIVDFINENFQGEFVIIIKN